MPYTVVDKGSKYFDTKLYTGTGATQSITGLNFAPDWVWIKERSASASAHNLNDIVRGAGKALFSNTTDAEYDYGTGTGGNLRSFDSTGFSLGTATQTNANGTTFVSWCWDANGAGVSNTQGTLTASVSANQTAGFSICRITEASSYSGVQTFGHGLGVAPSMVIYRQNNNTSNWQVYHKSTGTNLLQLNTTGAVVTGATFWPTVTSTLFGLSENVQAPTYTSIAYCFAEVKGYSKFGSYTGNGSTDGTFIYTGFKPAFVLQKNTSAVQGWQLQDNKRLGYNPDNYLLQPHTSQSESALQRIDMLSNGFKVRTTDAGQNSSGAVYIYMCFAENPFVSSTGIPTTAR